MVSEDPWADYARIQAGAQLNASISQSDADDVRLDRILDGIALGSAEETAGVERAVKSYARRERGRRRTRSLTGHAFMPLGAVCSVETLIWNPDLEAGLGRIQASILDAGVVSSRSQRNGYGHNADDRRRADEIVANEVVGDISSDPSRDLRMKADSVISVAGF